MFPHNTVTYVASFPPAALPAFIGTTRPSDSPRLICLPPSIISCPAYSNHCKRNKGPPGLPYNHNVKHAMVSDPGEAVITLPITVIPVLTSTIPKLSYFPTRQLRGSFPSAFRFTAYLLAVLRLKLTVTSQPPRTRYPVAGQPSGTGFSPAGLHALARPIK